MAFDNNLILDSGQTLANDADTTAINVEGGVYALLNLRFGTLGGTTVGLQARLEHQNDGTNWATCPGGITEMIDEDDDDVYIRQPVFIPAHDTKGTLTPVRLHYELSEVGDESFVLEEAWLEPWLSNAPPAVDKLQGEGLYADLPRATIALT